jgi:GDP-4-dehydro-6-deoxy-D-mannose reductase
MRILITGAGGFVGKHLIGELRQQFRGDVDILPTSRGATTLAVGAVPLDVTDRAAVRHLVSAFRPAHVIHLAGIAAIPAAGANSDATWTVHLSGALNVANAILEETPNCVLHYVGTGQVYGETARSTDRLDEKSLLAPTNVYTASKAAADLALGALTYGGLRCLRFRPFNHTGPGQSDAFVVPNFALQVARIKAGLRPPVLNVGNLAVERDFIDVRDVVAAYLKGITCSDTVPNNSIFNIASGTGYKISDILSWLIELAGIDVRVLQDSRRLRSNDIARFVGDASQAQKVLGWAPHIRFRDTLTEVLEEAMVAVKYSNIEKTTE